MVSKKQFASRLVALQLSGYGAVLLLLLVDEFFDLPHLLFGAPPTPVNVAEIALEVVPFVVLLAVTVALNRHLFNKIRFLEGYLVICAGCKKIRSGDSWMALESYISDHSESLFTHSLCPECAEKYHGDLRA